MQNVEEREGKKIPKSFVMERGDVGRAVSKLVLDMRRVMEPHTASKLKVNFGRAVSMCIYHVCST